MSSGLCYKDRQFECSNGIAELFLIKIIKHADEGSRLLNYAFESYRGFWPGFTLTLDDVVDTDEERNTWKSAVAKSIDDILHENQISESFARILRERRGYIISLCD